MSYEKQVWSKYDALKSEEENIENGAVVTDNRMNHMEDGISNSDDNLASHVADTNNPHKVTAAQAGLGNVQNFGLATENEAKQGASNAKYMTPSLTQAVLSANINSIAYAYSADGTDRFTTVYPNLNLLTDSKDFINKDLSGNNQKTSIVSPNSTVLKDGNDTYLNFISTADNQYWLDAYLVSDWSTTPPPDFINANILPNSKYTFSFWAKGTGVHKVHSWDYWTTPSNISTTFTLTNEWKYYSFTVTSSATIPVKNVEFFLRSVATGTEINLKYPKVEQGSTATPWMPSSSEVTTADYPKYVGFSNTVKTNKSASDYVWFPDLTNKVEDHVNNRSNPHGVTAGQTGAYTKGEVATLISEAIKQSKLDANPIGTILTTISNTNPSTYIGGTWERFANGRTLVSVDESDSVTLMQTANKMGGSTNPITEHRHDFAKVGSQQSYTFAWGTGSYGTSQVYLNTGQIAAGAAPNNNLLTRQSSDLSMTVEVGDNTNHNNWQPFMTVYFWRRTA